MILAVSNSREYLPTRVIHQANKAVCSVVVKTYEVAKALFYGVIYCIVFPLRYVGAKNWSIIGVFCRTPYVFFKRAIGISSQGKTIGQEIFNSGTSNTPQPLSPEATKGHLKRLAMAAFAHSSNADDWIVPFGYNPITPSALKVSFPGLEVKQTCFFDPISGFKVVLAEKDNEIMVGFGAIGSDQSEAPDVNRAHAKMFRKQNIKAVCNILGGDIDLFTQADQFFSLLMRAPHLQNKKIVLVGQCLGGSLAQYLSIKYQLPSYCYNTLQLGAGLQWQLGSRALSRATHYVTHVYVQGDFLNSWKGQGIVDSLLTKVIGVRTPGNFGNVYHIPSAYKKPSDIHNYAMGSAMKHIGYDPRTKPLDLPATLLQ